MIAAALHQSSGFSRNRAGERIMYAAMADEHVPDASLSSPLVLPGPQSWQGLRVLDPHRFPEHARGDAMVCGDRLALLAYATAQVEREVLADQERFLADLRADPRLAGFAAGRQPRIVVHYRNLGFLTGLYAALFTLKALLDAYARLVARTVVPMTEIAAFKEGVFQGRSVPGGRFLNWLVSSTPASYAERTVLATTVLRHVDGWIADAVRRRDQAIYGGVIEGLQEMEARVARDVTRLSRTDVVPPRMPNGVDVIGYSRALLEQASELVRETLPLLPGLSIHPPGRS